MGYSNLAAMGVGGADPNIEKLLDYTCTGSDASVTLTVAGNTDLEYYLIINNLNTSQQINVTLNGDTASNYGDQYLGNLSGSIVAQRTTNFATIINTPVTSSAFFNISTTNGFQAYALLEDTRWSSGTTISGCLIRSRVWNNTAQVTSITAAIGSGNFTANSRIIIYGRRAW
jgi:hypothetical protein